MARQAQRRSAGQALVAVLAALAAALAVIVTWLAWSLLTEPPEPPPPPPNGPTVEAIAEAVSKRLADDGYLKRSHFDKRTDGLNTAVSSLLTADEFNAAIAELKRTRGSVCCGDGSGTPHVSRIWVVFDNARLDDAPAGAEGVPERLTKRSRGIAISGAQLERLDRLRDALRACATADRPVRLEIQGFSSTREFMGADGAPMRHSEALNLKAANLRAANVIDHLIRDDGDAESTLAIRHVPWQTYADIRRPFLDAPEGVERAEQELLNRAVLVEVQDAGACAVEDMGEGSAR